MKRYIAFIILVLLVAACCLALADGKKNHKPTKGKKSLGKLKNDLKSVKKKKHDIKVQIHNTKAKIHVVKGTIQDLNGRIGDLEEDLADTRDNLRSSRSEQKKVGVELNVASKKLVAKKAEVQKRIRDMYMYGDVSLASALVSAKSLGDLGSEKFIFRRIADRDHQMFAEYKSLIATVAAKKSRADRLVVQVAGLMKRQKEKQYELNVTRSDQVELWGQLNQKQAELEKSLNQLDSDENEIESSIAAYNSGAGRHTNLVAPKGRLLFPITGSHIGNRDFGMKYHPILHRYRMHKGVDIVAGYGVSIHCAADGIVIKATVMRGFGNVLMVDHGGGISTVYAHCSRLIAHSGQRVKRGEIIGKVGSTGLATGPHLHFEVHVNNVAVNPRNWIASRG